MNAIYKLGDYEVDTLSRQLRLDGEPVALAQKPFEVLLYLIGRAGRVVTKDELMEAIWPQAFVEEANLTQSIFLLRKAFSDRAAGSRYIITVAGRGYQLGVAPILLTEPTEAEPSQPDPVQRIASDPDTELETIPMPLAASPDVPLAASPDMPLVAPRPLPSVTHAKVAAYRSSARILALLAVSVCVVGIVFAGWWFWHKRAQAEPVFTLRRLTNSGDVQVTAVSLSGKYAAVVSKSALGAQSISVSDLRSGSSREILHIDAEVINDLTFSPDDLYLYYRSHAKADPDQIASEHRLPLLGGDPILLIHDIDGPVSFIDGGKRFCFWRESGEDHFSVISANVENGKDEQTLAQSGRPMPASLACAPDGQRAALSTEVGGISILDFKTGSRQPFYQSAEGKEVYDTLQWKSDGSALIGAAFAPTDPSWSLFSLSYPQGVRNRITHDIDSYRSPGMTADGNTIVARQGVVNAQFQNFNLPLLATNPEVISFPWTGFLGWRDDGRIVGSAADGGIKTKEIAAGQETSIQTPAGMHFLQPNGCGADSLVSSGTGNDSSGNTHKEISIWHMGTDGSRLEQLTHGPEDILPACTPDGKWVLYADNSFRAKAAIYRVAAEGGPAAGISAQKIGEGSVWFAVSHKGDKVAWITNEGHALSLVQAEIATGRELARTPIASQFHITRSLTYGSDDQRILLISRGETSDSVYEMRLDQTPSTKAALVKQIEFRGAHLAAIAVSPSGTHLGVVTVKPVSDAVLLQRTNP